MTDAQVTSRAARRGRVWCRRGLRQWHVAVGIALAALSVLLMRDAWADIWHIADRDAESSQVMLAPVVAAWLFWVRRGRLRHYSPTATWAGPVLVLLGWGLYYLGDLHLYQSLWHLGAVVVAVGCFASLVGGGLLLRFLPAFGALAFLVPVPGRVRQAIALPLQEATARVTAIVLDTAGVGVERVGSVLRINQQDVMIAEACNGLRMVFALVIVSYAFAYGVPLRNGIRALVVLISPVTAILFNVLRLVPVVWGFGYFDVELANTLHDISAWVMLPCSFLALLGLMRVLRWAQVPISPYILAYGT